MYFCTHTGIGVYISRVEEGSVAERGGLRPGDTILEVNGTPFSGMTHEEALTVNDMSFAFAPILNVHAHSTNFISRTFVCSAYMFDL